MSSYDSNVVTDTDTDEHGHVLYEDDDDGWGKFDAIGSNCVLVDGIQRIRRFDRSYLDVPVCAVEDVIEALPSKVTSWDGMASMRNADSVRANADGIYTITDTASGPSNMSMGSSSNASARIKKRRTKSVAGQRQTSEKLRNEFKHIRVHDTGRRLGKFSEALEFAPADPAVLSYLKTIDGAVDGFKPEEWCFMLSCGDVQMAHLKMYDNPVVKGPNFTDLEDPEAGRIAMCNAVDWVQDKLALDEKLPDMMDLSMDTVRYDPSKSSGAHYRLQGYRTRGEVAEAAREEARLVVLALLFGNPVAHRPTRIGGRGKPINMSEEEARSKNVKKGRAIHMTDTRDGFVLGLTEQPLNDAWKEKKYPISVGRG
jgi:hypothetical protein